MRSSSTKTWVFLALCAASLILLILPPARARWVCGLVRPVLSPMGKLLTPGVVHLRTRVDEVLGKTTPADKATIDALEGQVQAARGEIDRLKGELVRVSNWRGLLSDFPCELVPARVVAGEGVPLRDRKIINAGTKQGLAGGELTITRRLFHEMPVALPEKLGVLGANSLVGVIKDAAAYTATLQLVTDSGFAMDGKLLRMVYPGQKRTIFVNVAGGGMEKRTAAHSAKPAGAELVGEPIDVRAVGDGRRLVVEHVKADYEIAPGDVLASSDRGQLLPLGLTVGKVATVERDKNDAHFVNITVEPIADLTTLQDVLVVIPYKKG